MLGILLSIFIVIDLNRHFYSFMIHISASMRNPSHSIYFLASNSNDRVFNIFYLIFSTLRDTHIFIFPERNIFQ